MDCKDERRVYIYNGSLLLGNRNLVRSDFRLGLSIGFSKLELLGQIVFVRKRSSGEASNSPRPALSVPHLDVNAHWRCRGQARGCKKVVFRGGSLKASVVCWRLQHLQRVISKIAYFETVVSNVLDFAVVYSRAFVLPGWLMQGLRVCFAWRLPGLNKKHKGQLWRMQCENIRKCARRTR